MRLAGLTGAQDLAEAGVGDARDVGGVAGDGERQVVGGGVAEDQALGGEVACLGELDPGEVAGVGVVVPVVVRAGDLARRRRDGGAGGEGAVGLVVGGDLLAVGVALVVVADRRGGQALAEGVVGPLQALPAVGGVLAQGGGAAGLVVGGDEAFAVGVGGGDEVVGRVELVGGAAAVGVGGGGLAAPGVVAEGVLGAARLDDPGELVEGVVVVGGVAPGAAVLLGVLAQAGLAALGVGVGGGHRVALGRDDGGGVAVLLQGGAGGLLAVGVRDLADRLAGAVVGDAVLAGDDVVTDDQDGGADGLVVVEAVVGDEFAAAWSRRRCR